MQANRLLKNVLLASAVLGLSQWPLSAHGQLDSAPDPTMGGVAILFEQGFKVPGGTPRPFITHLQRCDDYDRGEFYEYQAPAVLHLGTRLCSCYAEGEICPHLDCTLSIPPEPFTMREIICPSTNLCGDNGVRIKSVSWNGLWADVDFEICYMFQNRLAPAPGPEVELIFNVGQGTALRHSQTWPNLPEHPVGCRDFDSPLVTDIVSLLKPGEYEIQTTISERDCDGVLDPPPQLWNVFLNGETESHLLRVSSTGVVTLIPPQ